MFGNLMEFITPFDIVYMFFKPYMKRSGSCPHVLTVAPIFQHIYYSFSITETTPPALCLNLLAVTWVKKGHNQNAFSWWQLGTLPAPIRLDFRPSNFPGYISSVPLISTGRTPPRWQQCLPLSFHHNSSSYHQDLHPGGVLLLSFTATLDRYSRAK